MRRAGVLLHITSLPSNGPIGDLGPAAYRFLDWLASAGCKVWQVLPLNPIGGGNSPYSSPSAFAAEPALISLEGLAADGLLDHVPAPPPRWKVDWDAVNAWKRPLLQQAARRLAERDPGALAAYREANPWVDDWALYAAIADGGAGWWGWSPELQRRDPEALAAVRAERSGAIQEQIALQLLFDRQWGALRRAAEERGIQILGDMPLFVSAESSDTWADPGLFRLDAAGRPEVVAGAPPDDFTPEGQLWGSPIYDWSRHRADGFRWWQARVDRVLQHAHRVRIDHFRGLESTWTIPADAKTAMEGGWVKVPGAALLEALGDRPLFAEDLGLITPEVQALREAAGLPGMKVLQFAFGAGGDHDYLPHSYSDPGFVVYTGTHDNDTTQGWYHTASDASKDRYRRYVGRDGSDVSWDLIRLAWGSVAADAIAPFQDILDLGGEHRMNTPGTAEGNWSWRITDVPWWAAGRLRDLSESYGRL